MAVFDIKYIEAAHKHCSHHFQEIQESELCGCFCCLNVFKPEDINEWYEEPHKKGLTACCPKCGIDSVLGSKSGLPVSEKQFLNEMNEYWFS